MEITLFSVYMTVIGIAFVVNSIYLWKLMTVDPKSIMAPPRPFPVYKQEYNRRNTSPEPRKEDPKIPIWKNSLQRALLNAAKAASLRYSVDIWEVVFLPAHEISHKPLSGEASRTDRQKSI